MKTGFATLITLLIALLLVPQIATAAPSLEPHAQGHDYNLFLPTMRHAASAAEAAAKPKPLPPHSNAFGHTLAEWHTLYWERALIQADPGQIGNVRLLPIPQVPIRIDTDPDTGAIILVGEAAVTLKPGTAFMLPIWNYIGERYVGGVVPDDIPLGMEAFTESTVLITLNGHTLIDSSEESLEPYYYGPIEFDPAIVYDVPIDRNGVLAEAAIWAQGIGFLYPPLPVGTHTLVLYALTPFGFGFHNTWTITVEP